MTLRPTSTARRIALQTLLGLGLLGVAGGCDPRALFCFLQPFEPKIPPNGPSLKGKRGVILPRATPNARAVFPGLEDKLATGLARKIKENVRRGEVVPHTKVKGWIDAHPDYLDPSEAGLAFDADAVVFVEVEHFQIESALRPGLFQGQARIYVKLYNLVEPTDSKGQPIEGQPKEVIVAHETTVEPVFPELQGAIPQSATANRSAFRQRFFDIVVSQVSWEFVPRGTGDDIQDTSF